MAPPPPQRGHWPDTAVGLPVEKLTLEGSGGFPVDTGPRACLHRAVVCRVRRTPGEPVARSRAVPGATFGPLNLVVSGI